MENLPIFKDINKEKMFIIDQYNYGSNVIKVTMTPTAGFVAGIRLTFASGTITIDWKDGSAPETFTSSVEKTHTYVSAGTYIAEISGNILGITKFIADNCRITKIENLKTGLLTEFNIRDNLYSGELDMSLAPISGVFWVYNNTYLTSITFSTSGNAKVTNFRVYNNQNLVALDLSTVPIGDEFYAYMCSKLTSILFSATGNSKCTIFVVRNCDLTGTLDLSNVPISFFNAASNPKLTNITFSSSGNTICTYFLVNNCNLTGTFDLSNVPVGGEGSQFYTYSNSNLTSITFASSGNSTISDFRIHSCKITGTLDLSNVPISGMFIAHSNTLLTNIILKSSGNGVISVLQLYSCNIDYINLTALSLNANNCSWLLQNNSMVVGDVNHILVDCDTIASTGYTGRVINIGGTNADPDSSSGGYDGLAAKASLEGKGFTVTIT